VGLHQQRNDSRDDERQRGHEGRSSVLFRGVVDEVDRADGVGDREYDTVASRVGSEHRLGRGRRRGDYSVW